MYVFQLFKFGKFGFGLLKIYQTFGKVPSSVRSKKLKSLHYTDHTVNDTFDLGHSV